MPLLSPELVTPLVAYLCSEECKASGDIISAGGGFFAKAQMVESRGIRFEAGAEVTPEMVADRYGDITNMEGASPFPKAADEVGRILIPLAKK